jgi:protein translocase SecG subunit
MIVLRILLAIVAALLIIVVLVQNRSTGLSATFGGQSTFVATKRGPEKFLATATVVLAVLFLLLAFLLPLWTPLSAALHARLAG